MKKKDKHPAGLFYLSNTEMWERFSYYGIMSILILFLTKKMGFDDIRAGLVVGAYTSFTWMSPTLGGWLADRFIGQLNAVRYGGFCILIGNISLLFSGNNEIYFFLGLSVIVFGTGLLKSSAAVMVGRLYEPGDPRIDRAFTIYYMAINIGSLLAMIISYFAEKSNWHLGFGCAALGMFFGIFIFLTGLKHYKPDNLKIQKRKILFICIGALTAIIGVTFLFVYINFLKYLMTVAGALVFLYIIWTIFFAKSRRDRYCQLSILIYLVFLIVWYSLYNQMFDSIILFTDRAVDKNFFGFQLNAGMASLLFNSAFIVIFAPLLERFWTFLADRNLEPPTPVKFLFSMFILGFSFLIFAYQAKISFNGQMSSMYLLMLGYFVFTVAELLSGPIALSMIVQLSPLAITGFMMGAYYFSSALGGYFSGVLTAWSAIKPEELTNISYCAHIYYKLFLYCAIAILLFGIINIFFIPLQMKGHKLAEEEHKEELSSSTNELS